MYSCTWCISVVVNVLLLLYKYTRKSTVTITETVETEASTMVETVRSGSLVVVEVEEVLGVLVEEVVVGVMDDVVDEVEEEVGANGVNS